MVSVQFFVMITMRYVVKKRDGETEKILSKVETNSYNLLTTKYIEISKENSHVNLGTATLIP